MSRAVRTADEAEINIRIGRIIRRRRRLLGLTQQQVADVAGISFQQIQKYESAANTISAARLCTIARALSAPVSDFYAGAGCC